MKLELDSPRIPLAARALARLRDALSVRIVCEYGSVWVTIDGDTRDVVLSPGESFDADGRAGVLLYALEDSCLRVVEAGVPLAAGPGRPVRASRAAGAAADGPAAAPCAAGAT